MQASLLADEKAAWLADRNLYHAKQYAFAPSITGLEAYGFRLDFPIPP